MVGPLRMIPTKKVLTDCTQVNKAASVREGWSGAEKCVLSLRTKTLRCEMHRREVSDEVQVQCEALRAAVTLTFVCTGKTAANTKFVFLFWRIFCWIPSLLDFNEGSVSTSTRFNSFYFCWKGTNASRSLGPALAVWITGHKKDTTQDMSMFCEEPLAGIIAAGMYNSAGVYKLFET